jgi:hypothetical protein
MVIGLSLSARREMRKADKAQRRWCPGNVAAACVELPEKHGEQKLKGRRVRQMRKMLPGGCRFPPRDAAVRKLGAAS